MGRQILNQEGHTVETASNGDEAISYLSESRPDLVMLDTRMPGPSGYEVCEFIKNSDDLAQIKVVLLAGPLEPFDPAQATRVGSDAVLHKPLDAYSLIETVHSLIGKPKPAEAENSNEAAARVEEPAAAPEPESAPQPEPTAQEPEAAEAPAVEPVAEAAVEPPAVAATAPVSPFDELVQMALDDHAKAPALDEDSVRQAVVEVLEASLPTLAETITKRILARHEAK